MRSKVVAELKKHEIYNLETAQSLRVEDWDMLDLKMGTRRLILAKLPRARRKLFRVADGPVPGLRAALRSLALLWATACSGLLA